MTTMDGNLKAIHREALQRQARQRIDRIDELRAAKDASARNLTQREIAELLVTNQAKVHRLLKALERLQDDLPVEPEEMILRAFVYETDRSELTSTLKSFIFTFGEDAPYPHEGHLPGTWDQVVAAFAEGLLSKEEFDDVRGAIDR